MPPLPRAPGAQAGPHELLLPVPVPEGGRRISSRYELKAGQEEVKTPLLSSQSLPRGAPGCGIGGGGASRSSSALGVSRPVPAPRPAPTPLPREAPRSRRALASVCFCFLGSPPPPGTACMKKDRNSVKQLRSGRSSPRGGPLPAPPSTSPSPSSVPCSPVERPVSPASCARPRKCPTDRLRVCPNLSQTSHPGQGSP